MESTIVKSLPEPLSFLHVGEQRQYIRDLQDMASKDDDRLRSRYSTPSIPVRQLAEPELVFLGKAKHGNRRRFRPWLDRGEAFTLDFTNDYDS